MSTYLPIKNFDKPCIVSASHAKWFVDKELMMDEEGVYYIIDGRKYYVHDQVMTIAVKDKIKEPPKNKTYFRLFVIQRCDPAVQAYYRS